MTDRDQAFLQTVGDEDCTVILGAVQEKAKTVPELSEECDIPLSTAYRKVHQLQDAGLVEQKHRLRRDSKPKNVYERSFEAAVVKLANDGSFEVEFADSSMDRVASTSMSDPPQFRVRSD
jgi:predicted transcriptional regulator